MEQSLRWAQILVSVALVVVILLQTRGTSGGVFGGQSGVFRTRRGIEQTLFQLTIVLVVVFLVVAILNFRLG